LNVLLFAGQSNGIGSATSGELPAGITPPYADVRYWYFLETATADYHVSGGEISPPDPVFVDMDLHVRNTAAQRWGACLAMSDGLRDAGLPHAFVQVCCSGSTLATLAGTDTWDPGESGKLYDRLVAQALAACTQLQADNPSRTIRIVGLVWVQGEGDASVQARADAYDDNLTAFVEALESDLAAWIGILPLALVFNQLHVDSNNTYTANVRTSQANVAALDSDATPRWLVDIDDLTLIGPENIHLVGTDRGTMGERFATRYLTQRPLP